MANLNGPYGFRPVGHLTGGTIRMGAERSIATGYTEDIFYGDVVALTGTGTNIAVAAAEDVNALGIFAGCSYVDSGGRPQFKRYWADDTAATDIVAYVYDDPNIIYQIQCTTIAEADVGTLTDWDDSTNTGSAVTGNSGMQGDGAYATTGKSLHVIGLANIPGNAYGAYAQIHVAFAEHAYNKSISGVGGV